MSSRPDSATERWSRSERRAVGQEEIEKKGGQGQTPWWKEREQKRKERKRNNKKKGKKQTKETK